MVAPATVGFLELLVFFFATRLRETAFFAGSRLAVALPFIVRFLATDFFLTIRFLETAFFAGFRLAVVLRFIVRFLATIFLAAFFTVLGFLVLAFEPRDVVLLVAISHLN